MISLNNPGGSGDGGGGGGGAITETLTPGIISSTNRTEKDGTYNVDAGGYFVRVTNTGIETITINGVFLHPGEKREYRSYENRITSKYDLTPSLEIVVPINGNVTIEEDRPSA